MYRSLTRALAITSVAAVAGCAAPVIYDVEDDKAMIQATADDALTRQAANDACGIHGKIAVGPLSHRCIDGYCINKVYLFACKMPAAQQALQGSPAGTVVRTYAPER